MTINNEKLQKLYNIVNDKKKIPDEDSGMVALAIASYLFQFDIKCNLCILSDYDSEEMGGQCQDDIDYLCNFEPKIIKVLLSIDNKTYTDKDTIYKNEDELFKKFSDLKTVSEIEFTPEGMEDLYNIFEKNTEYKNTATDYYKILKSLKVKK